jgi:hypothetical protein
MEEPLKISEIIEQLKVIQKKYGDIQVGTWSDGIVKYIRSVKFQQAENNPNAKCAFLQWWEED